MTNRFDKLMWFKETCTKNHMNEMFLTELVSWMGEDEFNDFFKFHCSLWNIKPPEELEEEEDAWKDDANCVASPMHY